MFPELGMNGSLGYNSGLSQLLGAQSSNQAEAMARCAYEQKQYAAAAAASNRPRSESASQELLLLLTEE